MEESLFRKIWCIKADLLVSKGIGDIRFCEILCRKFNTSRCTTSTFDEHLQLTSKRKMKLANRKKLFMMFLTQILGDFYGKRREKVAFSQRIQNSVSNHIVINRIRSVARVG